MRLNNKDLPNERLTKMTRTEHTRIETILDILFDVRDTIDEDGEIALETLEKLEALGVFEDLRDEDPESYDDVINFYLAAAK